MNPQQTLLRRIALGAAALLLIGAVAYVSLRTGPLAPIKVTVTQPKEGSLSPAIFGIGTVEA
ncbi:MAG: efflux transporter periplasmic adaptor subunit, partial [Rhodoferax sp.]|nr:efflux transporter periplasmic adaptor subunit [Rhodoferax sp.]